MKIISDSIKSNRKQCDCLNFWYFIPFFGRQVINNVRSHLYEFSMEYKWDDDTKKIIKSFITVINNLNKWSKKCIEDGIIYETDEGINKNKTIK